MKDIIIVGTGKAALLHYISYKKIKNMGNIYFSDIRDYSKYIKNEKIYSSISECIRLNDLKITNLIIDICTPKSEFLSIIDICKELKIKNILVEKPFVVDKKTMKKYNDLNIVMVENYLFSKLTKRIKKYLDDNKKNISVIYSNFSKNRICDSLLGRGINKQATLNYEIEIPHQIYLTQFFLNNPKNIKNRITCSRDLRVGDKKLQNHGYGLILSKYKNIDIIYESNLASNITQKKIIISTTDGYTIEGNYAIYDYLQLTKAANMSIYYNGKILFSETILDDDNFTYFLNQTYLYFNNKGINPNAVDIISFSNIMNLYCKNLLSRKKGRYNEYKDNKFR